MRGWGEEGGLLRKFAIGGRKVAGQSAFLRNAVLCLFYDEVLAPDLCVYGS